MNRATIITDASWCPDTNAGGYAVWITLSVDGMVTIRKYSGQFNDLMESSNFAEVRALEIGIRLTKGHCVDAEILAHSDSKLALKYLNKEYDDVEFRHVKGHTQNKDVISQANRWCDIEARKRMKSHRKELQQL